jgi:hypothetical protein
MCILIAILLKKLFEKCQKKTKNIPQVTDLKNEQITEEDKVENYFFSRGESKRNILNQSMSFNLNSFDNENSSLKEQNEEIKPKKSLFYTQDNNEIINGKNDAKFNSNVSNLSEFRSSSKVFPKESFDLGESDLFIGTNKLN